MELNYLDDSKDIMNHLKKLSRIEKMLRDDDTLSNEEKEYITKYKLEGFLKLCNIGFMRRDFAASIVYVANDDVSIDNDIIIVIVSTHTIRYRVKDLTDMYGGNTIIAVLFNAFVNRLLIPRDKNGDKMVMFGGYKTYMIFELKKFCESRPKLNQIMNAKRKEV